MRSGHELPDHAGVSGPATVGMDACFVNLVEPGDTVVVCRNGHSCGLTNVLHCLGALEAVLSSEGAEIVPAAAVEAARDTLR